MLFNQQSVSIIQCLSNLFTVFVQISFRFFFRFVSNYGSIFFRLFPNIFQSFPYIFEFFKLLFKEFNACLANGADRPSFSAFFSKLFFQLFIHFHLHVPYFLLPVENRGGFHKAIYALRLTFALCAHPF